MDLLLCWLRVGAGLMAQEPRTLLTGPRGAVPVSAGRYRSADPDGKDRGDVSQHTLRRFEPDSGCTGPKASGHRREQQCQYRSGRFYPASSARLPAASDPGLQKSPAPLSGAEDLGAAPAGSRRAAVYEKRSSQ
jgi:hypothetical protein